MTCRPVAADLVIVKSNKILLIKRGKEPFKGMWALPGGRLEENESIEACAIREAKEETSLDIELKHLVGVYSDPRRDPRKVVAIAYIACPKNTHIKASSDAVDIKWVSIKEALDMKLAADHHKIIEDAWKMLQFHPIDC